MNDRKCRFEKFPHLVQFSEVKEKVDKIQFIVKWKEIRSFYQK